MCWNLHYPQRSSLLSTEGRYSWSRGCSAQGAQGGCEKPDKDTGEETLTQRAALPDQYTNTDADIVIDKPLLTTEGRKLSTIIGWNVSHSCQWCAPVSCHISSGSTWKMKNSSLGSFTCITPSPPFCVSAEDDRSNMEFVQAIAVLWSKTTSKPPLLLILWSQRSHPCSYCSTALKGCRV